MKSVRSLTSHASRAALLAVTLAMLCGAILSLSGCRTVEATGRRRLLLVGTQEETRMGRDVDGHIVSTMGLYPDESLQGYVRDLGSRMAAVSERPDLPWTFRVLDDELINAFAAPGGFIYVTRGILAYSNSEAELAGVLGHEIGHVTAKHSVIRLSRLQIARVGFGMVGAVLPDGGRLETLAGAGVQLMFLSFSRQDEIEADELGTRYMRRIGENPEHLIGVMEMLEQVSMARDGGTLPEWLSTHPSPGNRRENLAHITEPLDPTAYSPPDVEGYLRRIDGLVYGANPREGFTRGSVFYHPELRFRIDLPSAWSVTNQKRALIAVSPDEQAALQLSISEQETAEAAVRGTFAVRTDGVVLDGVLTAIEHEGRVYTLIGYGRREEWGLHGTTAERSFGSFATLTDPDVLAVQPMRLEIIRVRAPTTLEELYRGRSSPVPLSELALLNRVDTSAPLEAGRSVKWVAGRRVN